MLVILSEYPEPTRPQLGHERRILEIDELFSQFSRVYLSISYKHHYRFRVYQPNENLKVFYVNLFLHFFIIARYLIRARYIYVHALAFARFILPFYAFKKNIITEIHGISPEELHYRQKSSLLVAFYNWVEKIAVRYSYLLVTVSDQMNRHYQNKYHEHLPLLTLPTYSIPYIPERDKTPAEKLVLIYAGGIEAWHNIDMMIEAISKVQDDFEIKLFSGAVDAIVAKINRYGLGDKVQVSFLAKQELYREYSKADLAFILRKDDIVNRVACPTKLVEYLTYGLVPVVLQPHIGDFHEMGYSYVLLSDLLEGKIPSRNEIEVMRANNYQVIQRQIDKTQQGKQALLNFLRIAE